MIRAEEGCEPALPQGSGLSLVAPAVASLLLKVCFLATDSPIIEVRYPPVQSAVDSAVPRAQPWTAGSGQVSNNVKEKHTPFYRETCLYRAIPRVNQPSF